MQLPAQQGELIMLQRRTPREDEGETVSYSGPCLAELLAASGECEALSATDIESLESIESIESIESTVVIAGSSPSISFPGNREGPHAASYGGTYGASYGGSYGGSYGAVAYTLAPPAVVEEPRRTVARPGAALILASIGLVVGLFVGTSFSTDAPHPARPAAAQPAREPAAETTPLVSPTHQKVAAKRKGRGAPSVTPPVAHASAPAPPPTSPPSIVAEAPSDSQQLEDRRLLLAAEAERSF